MSISGGNEYSPSVYVSVRKRAVDRVVFKRWGDQFEKLKRLVPTNRGAHPRRVLVGVLLQALSSLAKRPLTFPSHTGEALPSFSLRRCNQPGPDLVDCPAIPITPFPNPQRPEALLALVGIVRPAPELKVLDSCRAAGRMRDDVMELEETTLGASVVLADERALSAVPLPHLASDCSGYMTRSLS